MFDVEKLDGRQRSRVRKALQGGGLVFVLPQGDEHILSDGNTILSAPDSPMGYAVKIFPYGRQDAAYREFMRKEHKKHYWQEVKLDANTDEERRQGISDPEWKLDYRSASRNLCPKCRQS